MTRRTSPDKLAGSALSRSRDIMYVKTGLEQVYCFYRGWEFEQIKDPFVCLMELSTLCIGLIEN